MQLSTNIVQSQARSRRLLRSIFIDPHLLSYTGSDWSRADIHHAPVMTDRLCPIKDKHKCFFRSLDLGLPHTVYSRTSRFTVLVLLYSPLVFLGLARALLGCCSSFLPLPPICTAYFLTRWSPRGDSWLVRWACGYEVLRTPYSPSTRQVAAIGTPLQGQYSTILVHTCTRTTVRTSTAFFTVHLTESDSLSALYSFPFLPPSPSSQSQTGHGQQHCCKGDDDIRGVQSDLIAADELISVLLDRI